MNPFYNSLRNIWRNPRFVKINEAKLWEIILKISKEDLEIPNWRLPVYYPNDDENFVQFLGIVSSINFAFTDFTTKRKFAIKDWRSEFKSAKPWRGAFGMAASLLRAIDQSIPILDAGFLKNITLWDMEYIFQSISGYSMPMLKERTEIFQEIGKVLLGKYDGSFYNLFKSADFKAFGAFGIINQLSDNFPSFRDIGCYQHSSGMLYKLDFYKRAQLFVMVYYGRALDSNGRLPLIKDIDDLGAIADYQIPRILEHLGVLEYSPLLKKKILNQEIIKQDSWEELEIRAMTVLVVKRILEESNKLRKNKINICHLDYKFWDMARKIRIKTPHHLTPTIAY